MKLAMTISAASVLAIISSAAPAQQALTGIVTMVDRISNSITIQPTPSGTVGAAGSGADRYKIQGSLLEAFHAGDMVSYSFSEANGTRTIVKIDKK